VRDTLAIMPAPRTVVLKHVCPPFGHHFDWMLQVLSDQDRSLLTIRMSERPDLAPANGCLEGVLLPAHRTIYLTYEGPLTGGRGSVARMREGDIIATGDPADPAGFVVSIDWFGDTETRAYTIRHTSTCDAQGNPVVMISMDPVPAAD